MVTSSFSLSWPKCQCIHNQLQAGLTFSSFGGKEREDGEVALECLTVPLWPEGQACCPLFGRARTQSRKFCTQVAILCTKRRAHGETAFRRLPEAHLAPEPTLPRMAGGALSPEHMGSAAGTGAHPAPINHIPAPSALYSLVLLPPHQPILCSGKV